MPPNQGLTPPGYESSAEARQKARVKNDSQKRKEAQERLYRDLQSSLPPNMLQNREPLQYDSDGIPIAETPPPMHEGMLNQPQQQQPMQQMHPGHPAAAQQQQPQKPRRPFFDDPNLQAQVDTRMHPDQAVPQAQPQENHRVRPQAPVGGNQNQSGPGVMQDNLGFTPPTPGTENYKHPVVQKLLAKFGLKKSPKYDLDVYTPDGETKITYTMTQVPDEISMWALEQARDKNVTTGSDRTAFVYFEVLFTCCSVVAMDGEPAWRIFEIKPTEQEAQTLANDPFDLSLRMRKAIGYQLAQLMWSKTLPFADKLIEFYQQKITQKKMFSSFDREQEGTVRYVCPVDGCTNYEIAKPEYDEETGAEKELFCKIHGVSLIKTLSAEEESDLPLG